MQPADDENVKQAQQTKGIAQLTGHVLAFAERDAGNPTAHWFTQVIGLAQQIVTRCAHQRQR